MSGWRLRPAGVLAGLRGGAPTATRSSTRAGAGACWARSGLARRRGQPPREISHGEQRQLELAIALAATPRLCCSTSRRRGCRRTRRRRWSTLVAQAQGALHDRARRAQDGRDQCHLGRSRDGRSGW
jgi:ABC-type branched-subunit amino acid transport system ATPase component